MFGKKQHKTQQPVRELSPEEKTEVNIKRKTRLIKQLKHDAIFKIIGFIAVITVCFTFIFGVSLSPTNDMFPAIHEGDLVIFFRPGRIVNTDVVLYEAPDGSSQIGRVEGTEGETVGKSEGGLLTINGNIQPVQKRSGLYDETYAGKKDISGEIGNDMFLILADSRETATDSRTYGLITRKEIKGKIFTIIRRRPL